MKADEIQYLNRSTGKLEIEKVYGQKWMDLLYGNPLGYLFTKGILKKRWASQAIGWFKSNPASALQVPEFIEEFKIPMEEYEEGPFHTFNEFFIRRFRDGAREWEANPNRFAAPAEARYFFFPEMPKGMPVKGHHVSLAELVGDPDFARDFDGGAGFIARLCPVDYHRFHFPFEGKILKSWKVEGAFHSVNPVALERNPKIFLENEREVTILESPVWGKVAYIEVGALGVGKIIQSYGNRTACMRGQEKGYFLFGGSTVVCVFEPGRIKFDKDLVDSTFKGIETWLPLGSGIGDACS